MLAFVAHCELEIEQLDTKTVFLHRDLDETIYIKYLRRFIDKHKPDYVCLLKRSFMF